MRLRVSDIEISVWRDLERSCRQNTDEDFLNDYLFDKIYWEFRLDDGKIDLLFWSGF